MNTRVTAIAKDQNSWSKSFIDELAHAAGSLLFLLFGPFVDSEAGIAARFFRAVLLVCLSVLWSVVLWMSRYELYVPIHEELAGDIIYAQTIPAKPQVIDLSPVRPLPKDFPARHRMPVRREIDVSMAIGSMPFKPSHDLVRVDDDRVWWESDNDTGDTEDDHLMHVAMVVPFRRVLEMVSQHEGVTLKVQDSYRAQGIHASKSLHKEGRAIDLTADGMSLSDLAKICWAAGFDWVYYEAPKSGGAHIHASVKPLLDHE
ncbi:MAG: DUF882 domain-containing protein [Spartobacteria bacterium]|nr:DUF882 domain-containing protein [Spartobacteria bacterium]